MPAPFVNAASATAPALQSVAASAAAPALQSVAASAAASNLLDPPAPLSELPPVPADAVARELSRCQEQLNLVFEVTAHTTCLHDPDIVQTALLRRYAAVLRAGAVFLDRGGCCMRIELEHAPPQTLAAETDQVRGALATYIETARRGRRSIIPELAAPERARLGDAHVLLGTLQRADLEPAVIIALRAASEPAFDAHDLVASDSVLGYGAQMLGNVLMIRHLQRTALETVCTLVNAIDAKDNYTSSHSERVGWLARLAGEALGLPRPRLQVLEWAGLLHDVGKIGIPEQVLNKPGPLSADELELMRRHARIGYDVLKPVAQFRPVLKAVLHHHENHDGSGYPDGLTGDQIPLEARLIHIVDIFDALTTDRPYRRGYPLASAYELLNAGAGRATAPDLTRLFIDALRQFAAREPNEFRARFGHLILPSAPGVVPPACPWPAPPGPAGTT